MQAEPSLLAIQGYPVSVRSTFLLLALLSVSSACTLRYAPSNYADPLLNDARSGVPIEGGGYLWEGIAFGERADVGILGTYEEFDLFTEAAATHLEFRARWFPLEPGWVDPFAGGGLGIYRLNRTERNPRCRLNSICLTDSFEARGQATGLTPHIVVGTEIVPGSSPVAVVLGVVREFGVFDPEWDLTAWRFSVGLTARPNR